VRHREDAFIIYHDGRELEYGLHQLVLNLLELGDLPVQVVAPEVYLQPDDVLDFGADEFLVVDLLEHVLERDGLLE
jgi:hypothetical protein